MAKKVIVKEIMLAHPNFLKPFQVHIDASQCQLGGGQTNCFYRSKLNKAQTCHTTTERELLSVIENLKECRTFLLGHEIEVFTDHKNLSVQALQHRTDHALAPYH